MSSSKAGRILGSVQVRLLLWHAGLLGVVAAGLFLSGDGLLRSQLLSRTGDEMLATVRQFRDVYEVFGLGALADEFEREAESMGAENVAARLLSPSLVELASSDASSWEGLRRGVPDAASLAPGEVRRRIVPQYPGGGPAAVVEMRLRDGNLLQVGRSLAQNRAALQTYRLVFGSLLLGMVAVGLCGGWFLTRTLAADVEAVTRTARRIGETDLAARVPTARLGRELRDLAEAFNEMLDRLRAVITEMGEMTDNVAHDLRSPLTRMRGLAESMATDPAAGTEVRERAGAIVEECDRLAGLVDTLLEIAEARAGMVPRTTEAVDLAAVAREAGDLYEAVAEQKGVSLTVAGPSAPAVVRGDLGRLQRALANVLDNAVKYTNPGGAVRVEVSREGEWVLVTVSDTGVGIAAEDLPHVFKRFFRGEASRSTPGSGLGLALTEAVVRAHGGRVSAESTPGKGSRFVLSLPAAASGPT